MITNIPTDIEKKIDNVYISLIFNKLTASNVLKNVQPTDAELELLGNALKIRIQPGDSKIDFKNPKNKSGGYWDFKLNCIVEENNKVNFDALNRFSNQKIVLFIGTSTFRYQIGHKDQPLDFNFSETINGFNVSFSGKSYFPASRKQITSFRSTI